jgi:hypothetical protein
VDQISATRNPDTTYIDLHHLYITQRAILRNGVQAGEENLAYIRGFCKLWQAAAMLGNTLFLIRNEQVSGSSPLVDSLFYLQNP